jgi:hypothetical protein
VETKVQGQSRVLEKTRGHDCQSLPTTTSHLIEPTGVCQSPTTRRTFYAYSLKRVLVPEEEFPQLVLALRPLYFGMSINNALVCAVCYNNFFFFFFFLRVIKKSIVRFVINKKNLTNTSKQNTFETTFFRLKTKNII